MTLVVDLLLGFEESADHDTLLSLMQATCHWINDYLDPPASAEEQADLLTKAGFPLEGTESVEGDVLQDFEMTSNRGDCVCHIGLAREIAAISGRTLKLPTTTLNPTGPPVSEIATVTNREPDLCPLYTARVIRGIKVGSSPEWLAHRLRARGDIPRNNVVDATNFVQFEWGQPTHVFDLSKLKNNAIIIRRAAPDELFLPLGEGEAEIKLNKEDLVIADAERVVALAGVKGGELTAVTEQTTDILIEAATFHPVSVRNTSRRHNIATDSSYRFERNVHPGQINEAADRLAGLILDMAGGSLCEGVLSDGKPIPQRRAVSMRVARCHKIMGVTIRENRMLDVLERLGFEPKLNKDRIDCLVPIHRLDIEREIDLIEEVGRMFGHDSIPIAEKIEIRIAPAQSRVMAMTAIKDSLVGMGYLETITHSLIGKEAAKHFLMPGTESLRVDDDRAKAWPILRPSILPSLLRVRKLNQDNGVNHLKMFESGSTFWQTQKQHQEVVKLGLLADVEDPEDGLRPMRGIIERLAHLLKGPDAIVDVTPDDPPDNAVAWFNPGGTVTLDGRDIGRLGLIPERITRDFGLDAPVIAAEIETGSLIDQYPPDTEAHSLPAFPAIERDVSAIIDESVTWAGIHVAVNALGLEHLEAVDFITVFRGNQIGAKKKSLSFRLCFRARDRTLKHEEVDPQMESVIEMIMQKFKAEIRR